MSHPVFSMLRAWGIAPLLLVCALAFVSGCAHHWPASRWTANPGGVVRDPARWSDREPDEREAAPATAILIREFDMAIESLERELDYVAASGATAGQQNTGRQNITRLRDFRRQVESVLVDSSGTAPWSRQFCEALYSRHPVDGAFRFEALADSLTFAEVNYPVYDTQLALDPDRRISIAPYNMDAVYTGVAGTEPDAVRGAYSPTRLALLEDATVPRIYRFSPRYAYAKDMTDAMLALGDAPWRMMVPSIINQTFPGLDDGQPMPARSLRLGIFSASRARTTGGGAATDLAIFYWLITDEESDVVIADSVRQTALFLGMDYVVAPADMGRPALAWPVRPPVKKTGPEAPSPWRVAAFGPFEALTQAIVAVKQTVGEIVRAPVALVSGTPRHGLRHGAVSAWRSVPRIGAIWEMQFRNRPLHGPHVNLLILLGEVPLIGKAGLFTLGQSGETEETLDARQRHIFLTGGAGLGGDGAQFTQNWQQILATAYARPNALNPEPANVAASAYKYGLFLDVVWSALNLSDGAGYEMARDILYPDSRMGYPAARPGETIYLVGHGAGVQRATDAARLLTRAGAPVRKMIGVEGVSVGHVPGLSREKGNFLVLRSERPEGPGRPRRDHAVGQALERTSDAAMGAVSWPARAIPGQGDRAAGSSATLYRWDTSADAAALAPGAIDPLTGRIHWRPGAEEIQKLLLD